MSADAGDVAVEEDTEEYHTTPKGKNRTSQLKLFSAVSKYR